MTTNRQTVLSLSVLLLLLTLSTVGWAQSGVSLYHLGTRILQINQFNPAQHPDGTFYMAFPFISQQSVSVKNSFAFNEAFEKTGAGKYHLLNEQLYKYAGESGCFNLEVDKMSLFGAGFYNPEKGWGFTVFSNVSSRSHFFYSENLFKMLLSASAQSLGKELVMNNAQINSMTYADVGVGIQRSFLEDRLKIGVNLKYLMGIAYLRSHDNLQLRLITDPNTYALTLTTKDISLEYVLPLERTGIPLSEQENPKAHFSPFQNPGLAIDLGVTYKLLENLEISVSATDFGAIAWHKMSREYLADSTFTITGDDLRESHDRVPDLLGKRFEKKYTQLRKKVVPLHSRVLFSTKYNLSAKDALHLTYMSVLNLREGRNLYALGYSRAIGEKLMVSLNGVKQSQQNLSLGVGAAFKVGRTQLYASTDNLLGVVQMSDARGTDLRFGLNYILDAASKPRRVASENQVKVL